MFGIEQSYLARVCLYQPLDSVTFGVGAYHAALVGEFITLKVEELSHEVAGDVVTGFGVSDFSKIA